MKNETSPAFNQLLIRLLAMAKFHFDPRWLKNPVAQRARRPKILGAESAREKSLSDKLCADYRDRRFPFDAK